MCLPNMEDSDVFVSSSLYVNLVIGTQNLMPKIMRLPQPVIIAH